MPTSARQCLHKSYRGDVGIAPYERIRGFHEPITQNNAAVCSKTTRRRYVFIVFQ